jgi:penicillin-binding protein 1A
MPHDLTLALGTLTTSPIELAQAYAVFANGGYRVEPYLIERVENLEGKVIYLNSPMLACDACAEMPAPVVQDAAAVSSDDAHVATQQVTENLPTPLDLNADLPWSKAIQSGLADAEYVPEPPRYAPKVLDDTVVYMMNSMMRDVVRRGTGTIAKSLGRDDLAAKTGTTNDARDAWFNGFNAAITTVAWVGFDQAKPLGSGEVGSQTAGPMWVNFMRTALQGVPQLPLIEPPGLVTVRISPQTGMQVSSDDPNGIFEVFPAEHVPAIVQRQPTEQEQEPENSQENNVIQDLF